MAIMSVAQPSTIRANLWARTDVLWGAPHRFSVTFDNGVAPLCLFQIHLRPDL